MYVETYRGRGLGGGKVRFTQFVDVRGCFAGFPTSKRALNCVASAGCVVVLLHSCGVPYATTPT
jgi:hypothetical protein